MVHKATTEAAGDAGGCADGNVEAPALASAAWISRVESAVPGLSEGPLAGLLFAVKDNIDVQGLPTTAACPAFAYTPTAHAAVVQRLVEAGAVVSGKTNLDQFACGLNGTRSPHGPVPNAFNDAYVSGGSSAGSAYVVATGQVDFSLGTDTAGSGRVPAGLNNIVGLKPSKGLISAIGVVPAAQSVDCVSIFARSVALAAKVLAVAMGYDAQDPFSRALTLKTTAWPVGFRFGVPSLLEFFGDSLAEVEFGKAVARLRELGGTEVSVDYTPLAGAAALLYESALVAERYAAVRGFFDANARDIIEPVRSIIGRGREFSAADLYDAQLRLRQFERAATAMWQEIDVLVVPTAPTHYTIDQMQADPIVLNRNLGAYTNFVNLLDYAAISVPSSIRADDLPFGITLIGPCGSDWQLADLGQRYHHASGMTQGATGVPLSAPVPIAGLRTPATVTVAVVGAHLSGMPLNAQLTERGATLLGEARTTTDYRLYALKATVPPKPGMVRVAPGTGAAIVVELWKMPLSNYGSFVAMIPAPLGVGMLNLADGTSAQGFLCEAQALCDATDISHFGGWRPYVQSLQPHQSPPST